MQLKLIKTARIPDDIPFVEMGDKPKLRELDIHYVVDFECEDGNFDIENNEEIRETLRLIMKAEGMQTQKIIKAFEEIGLNTVMDFVEDGWESYFKLRIYSDGRHVVDIEEYRDSVDISFQNDLGLLNSKTTAGIIKILYELVLEEETCKLKN